MEVTQAEFAYQCGVTRQSIHAKIKNGTLQLNSAGKIDTDNMVNARYLSTQRQKKEQKKELNAAASISAGIIQGSVNLPQGGPITSTDAQLAQSAGIPAQLLSLNLRQLVSMYNGILPLEKHAKILKDLAAADEKDQKVRERRLSLIEKDFVVARVFAYIDSLMARVLEYPDGSADTLIALVQSKGPDARQEFVEIMKNGLSKEISGAKTQIIDELNGLKSKYSTNGIDELKDAIDDLQDQQEERND